MKNKNFLQKIFTGKQGRKLREYLTAYAFIAPASILIFIFGIFPVGFAIFVSLHKWRIKRTDFIGLENYVDAIGNLAYVLVFFIGIGALFGSYLLLKRIFMMAKENDERPWLCAIPGIVFSAAVFAFFNWFYRALPNVLDIAFEIRRLQERTQAVFFQLLRDALRSETVLPAWRLFFWLLIAGLIIGAIVYRFWRNRRNLTYQTNFALVFVALGAGVGLLVYVFQQITIAYADSIAADTDPGIWPQFIMISGGVILLGIAWVLWRRAEKQDSNWRFWLHILAALTLLVGGWLLIGEIPQIVAAGDPDLWEGLKVTVFFSLGTVPFQLAIALFLSVLLFQKLKGSNIFRILFFIPYVTPGIASAAIFQQMFSNRQSAPINMLFKTLGMAPQQWLNEPKGIIVLLGEAVGISIPQWAAGPSLALVVIMLHSIWTYVGYDTVIYLAGLGNIPEELNDAAEVDGANSWQVFRHITFPLLSPTTYFLSLIAIIGTFKAFNTIWILRSNLALGTTDTFSVTIFVEFFEKLRYGYASALAFILFAIILSLSYINNKTQGSKVFYG
jgi:multiple sugar transport system permease protein